MSDKANLMAMRLEMRALERRVVQLESSRPNIPSYSTTTYEERVMTHEQARWMVDALAFEYEEGDTSKWSAHNQVWNENFQLWLAKHLVNASEAYWFNVEENADKAANYAHLFNEEGDLL
jgi:hypothetical protein